MIILNSIGNLFEKNVYQNIFTSRLVCMVSQRSLIRRGQFCSVGVILLPTKVGFVSDGYKHGRPVNLCRSRGSGRAAWGRSARGPFERVPSGPGGPGTLSTRALSERR